MNNSIKRNLEEADWHCQGRSHPSIQRMTLWLLTNCLIQCWAREAAHPLRVVPPPHDLTRSHVSPSLHGGYVSIFWPQSTWYGPGGQGSGHSVCEGDSLSTIPASTNQLGHLSLHGLIFKIREYSTSIIQLAKEIE